MLAWKKLLGMLRLMGAGGGAVFTMPCGVNTVLGAMELDPTGSGRP